MECCFREVGADPYDSSILSFGRYPETLSGPDTFGTGSRTGTDRGSTGTATADGAFRYKVRDSGVRTTGAGAIQYHFIMEVMDTRETPENPDLHTIAEEARALNNRAWESRKLDVQQARLLAEESLTLCRELLQTDPGSQAYKIEYANALLTLSFCDVRLASYTEALDKAQEALRYFEETGNDYGRLYCMENMVKAHGMRGELSPALDLANQCLHLAETLNDTEARGRAMNLLGVLYWHTGKYNSSLGWYLQGLSLLKETNNRQEMSEILNNLGLIYTSLGDYDKAYEYCISGLLVKQEVGDKLGESHALLNIGNLYMHQEEPEKALEHYLECLYIQEEISDRDGRGHTLINLANVYLKLDDPDRAVECIGACLELARAIGDRRIESYALTMAAAVHERHQEYDRALETYLQSLYIRHEIGYQQGEISTLTAIGALCIQLERYDEASIYLQDALRIARALQTRNRMYEVHEKLADLYEKSNEPARALYHHKQFYLLQKECTSEQAQLRVKNLQALYELEQATKEARIYQLENIELESANAEILQQKNNLEQQTLRIREANRQLQEKNRLLEYLNREKDEFLGVTVHGLKNPLTNIALAVAMLRNKKDKMSGEEIEHHLDWIESTVWRMDDIVQKLLRSNALEAGKVPLQPVTLVLPPLVAQVADNYTNRAAVKNIRLVTESGEGDLTAFADPAMTEDIIDNLVSNALKFSPAHTTVRVRVYLPDEAQAADEVSVVRIAVQDEGPGITAEDRKRLFGRFERLSARPTGNEPSSGLGLSIVKKLTDTMNGKVWCESLPGKGATFIVELPAAPRHNPEPVTAG